MVLNSTDTRDTHMGFMNILYLHFALYFTSKGTFHTIAHVGLLLVAGPWMCAGLRSQTNDFQGCDIDTFHSYTTFLNALQHNSFEHVCTSIEHHVSSPASTKGARGSAISLLYITFFYPCQLLHACDLLYQQVPKTWQMCVPSARNFNSY